MSPPELYDGVLDAWNRRDPSGYASLFVGPGHVIGFDGSEMRGRSEIEATLGRVFTDHEARSA